MRGNVVMKCNIFGVMFFCITSTAFNQNGISRSRNVNGYFPHPNRDRPSYDDSKGEGIDSWSVLPPAAGVRPSIWLRTPSSKDPQLMWAKFVANWLMRSYLSPTLNQQEKTSGSSAQSVKHSKYVREQNPFSGRVVQWIGPPLPHFPLSQDSRFQRLLTKEEEEEKINYLEANENEAMLNIPVSDNLNRESPPSFPPSPKAEDIPGWGDFIIESAQVPLLATNPHTSATIALKELSSSQLNRGIRARRASSMKQKSGCQVQHLSKCKKVIDGVQEQSSVSKKCKIREKFLTCMEKERKKGCSSGADLNTDPSVLRSSIMKSLKHSRGCLLL